MTMISIIVLQNSKTQNIRQTNQHNSVTKQGYKKHKTNKQYGNNMN